MRWTFVFYIDSWWTYILLPVVPIKMSKVSNCLTLPNRWHWRVCLFWDFSFYTIFRIALDILRCFRKLSWCTLLECNLFCFSPRFFAEMFLMWLAVGWNRRRLVVLLPYSSIVFFVASQLKNKTIWNSQLICYLLSYAASNTILYGSGKSFQPNLKVLFWIL